MQLLLIGLSIVTVSANVVGEGRVWPLEVGPGGEDDEAEDREAGEGGRPGLAAPVTGQQRVRPQLRGVLAWSTRSHVRWDLCAISMLMVNVSTSLCLILLKII